MDILIIKQVSSQVILILVVCDLQPHHLHDCETTFSRHFVNNGGFKFVCCTPPLSVNLICLVDTTLSPPSLSSTRDIQTSVPVTYLLYVGRYGYCGGDESETVSSVPGVGTGTRGASVTRGVPSFTLSSLTLSSFPLSLHVFSF